ncbi:hypothetical protein [Halorubrum sp. AS12]
MFTDVNNRRGGSFEIRNAARFGENRGGGTDFLPPPRISRRGPSGIA